MSLDGKIALVFGGSSGIGEAICDLLLQRGANVCIADVQSPDRPPAEDSKRWLYIQTDITSTDSIEEAFARLRSQWSLLPAFVVYTVGILDEHRPEYCVDVNLCGVIRTLLAALKHMSLDTGGTGGSFLSFSSIAALDPFAAVPVYSATKAGVFQFTRAYAGARHYSKHGVRINTILPGPVNTPMTRNMAPKTLFDTSQDMPSPELMMSPVYVAECALELLENEDSNGICLRLTQEGGKENVQTSTEGNYTVLKWKTLGKI